MKRFAIGVMIAALVSSIIVNVVLYLRYSGNRTVMTMGKTVITQKDYREALERQYGKAVLRKLVLARLVEREARRKGVLPKEAEVDMRLKEMEQRTPGLVQQNRTDATSLYNLQSDIFTDLALQRLRVRDVNITDTEIATYYTKHPEQFTRPMQVSTTAVLASNKSDAVTAATLLQQDMKPYVIARQPRLRVVGVGGFQPDLSKLAPSEVTQLQTTMAKMHSGEVATVPIKNEFLIFRVKSQEKMGVLPFDAVRIEVTRLAKLAKAPSPTDYLLHLYQESHPVFEANQYAEFFREFEEISVVPVKTALKKTSITTASR